VERCGLRADIGTICRARSYAPLLLASTLLLRLITLPLKPFFAGQEPSKDPRRKTKFFTNSSVEVLCRCQQRRDGQGDACSFCSPFARQRAALYTRTSAVYGFAALRLLGENYPSMYGASRERSALLSLSFAVLA